MMLVVPGGVLPRIAQRTVWVPFLFSPRPRPFLIPRPLYRFSSSRHMLWTLTTPLPVVIGKTIGNLPIDREVSPALFEARPLPTPTLAAIPACGEHPIIHDSSRTALLLFQIGGVKIQIRFRLVLWMGLSAAPFQFLLPWLEVVSSRSVPWVVDEKVIKE